MLSSFDYAFLKPHEQEELRNQIAAQINAQEDKEKKDREEAAAREAEAKKPGQVHLQVQRLNAAREEAIRQAAERARQNALRIQAEEQARQDAERNMLPVNPIKPTIHQPNDILLNADKAIDKQKNWLRRMFGPACILSGASLLPYEYWQSKFNKNTSAPLLIKPAKAA